MQRITPHSRRVLSLAAVTAPGLLVASCGSDGLEITVGEFTLSMGVYSDLDGTNHEVAGVPLDVESPFDQALDAALDHLG